MVRSALEIELRKAAKARERAYSPADCGVSSSLEVSAPRTICASCCKAGSSSWYFFRNASQLHSATLWVNSTHGMS